MALSNNDILRRIRYALDYTDDKVLSLFNLAEYPVSREQLASWLNKEEEPGYQPCADVELAAFLNGLICERRGRREGAQPAPEVRLNNNIIFRKLRIALNLQDDDILAMLAQAGLPIGKAELGALFRKPEHKHYRQCKDQILRNFLRGMQLKYRAAPTRNKVPPKINPYAPKA